MKRLWSIKLHGLPFKKNHTPWASKQKSIPPIDIIMINELVTERERNSNSISFSVHKKQKQKKSQLLPKIEWMTKEVYHKPYTVGSEKHPTSYWITFQGMQQEYFLGQAHLTESVMHCKIKAENQGKNSLEGCIMSLN